MRRFAAAGIEFAYPTRTLFLENVQGGGVAALVGGAAPAAEPTS